MQRKGPPPLNLSVKLEWLCLQHRRGWKSTTVTCEMRICGERTGLNAPAELLTRAYLQRMWEARHCRGGRTRTSPYVRPLSSESPSAPEPAGLLSSFHIHGINQHHARRPCTQLSSLPELHKKWMIEKIKWEFTSNAETRLEKRC